MIFRSFLPAVTRSHLEKRVLNTNPRHLFRIINDVDQYSKFLPLCSRSHVIARLEDHVYRATLTVGMPPLFQETYTSHVVADPERLIISAKSVESKLFDSLSSQWRLTPIHNETDRESRPAEQCLVDFYVSLTVRDPLIVGTLDQILKQVASRQVEAFEKRCREIPDVSSESEIVDQ
jgi:coenzyme Q-binding protein COQ10